MIPLFCCEKGGVSYINQVFGAPKVGITVETHTKERKGGLGYIGWVMWEIGWDSSNPLLVNISWVKDLN